MGGFLATILGSGQLGSKIVLDRADGLFVHFANHMLSASLHDDESGVPEFFEMKTDGGRDFVDARDAATDLSNRWARDLSDLPGVGDRHRPAARP